MSAGTLTLTNNSAAVAGSGTAFTTEVAAGDFIVVTVGGVPYTLPIKSVESGTALTLVSNFTGPTQSGAAWSAVPRVALNMVTAALVAQSAEALRGLNYDKQNWQQLFSGTGDVTVKLPDGSSFTGPAWGSITTELSEKADKTALGDYAKKGENSDITKLSGLTTPLSVKQGGIGSSDAAGGRANLLAAHRQNSFTTSVSSQVLYGGEIVRTPGVWTLSNSSFYPTDYGTLLTYSNGPEDNSSTGIGIWYNMLVLGHNRKVWHSANINGNAAPWDVFYTAGNTTTDSNGNLKPASPVVKLKGDGTAELNDESEGVSVERLETGIYKISGVLGFNSDPVWGGNDGGYVIPQNSNGLPLLWVDCKILPDGDLIISTYHRAHSSAPEYARNLIGIKNDDGSFTETVKDGDPVDIPAGRWIDLRVEMPQNSIWNQKLKDMLEAMEKAEYERQQNQQDAQM
ncbi:phage tail protein [Citrobacter freundii]|nr:phage tail protein [Citrobacter freundii]